MASRFQQVTVLTLEKMKAHQGHMIVATRYGKTGKTKDAVDYSLECEDCSLVLADWERKEG